MSPVRPGRYKGSEPLFHVVNKGVLISESGVESDGAVYTNHFVSRVLDFDFSKW